MVFGPSGLSVSCACAGAATPAAATTVTAPRTLRFVVPRLAAVPLQDAVHRVGSGRDRVGRDALVGGVDEVHEAEVVGQAHRREAVALDAEPAEVAGVGDAGEQQ